MSLPRSACAKLACLLYARLVALSEVHLQELVPFVIGENAIDPPLVKSR